MTKNELIERAAELRPPGPECTRDFHDLRETLAARVIAVMRSREDLERLIGAGNESMMIDNAHNMSRFLDSLFHGFDPGVLVETVFWVFRAYRSHGFALAFWPAHLNAWIEACTAEMDAGTCTGAVDVIEWILVHIPSFAEGEQAT